MTIFKFAMTAALFGTAVCGLASATSVASPAETADTEAVAMLNTSMLTVITRSDPETQLMALILTKAAIGEGKTPRILLCGAAGDLALKTPPEALQKPLAPKGVSPSGLLSALLKSGVSIDVCAIYLPNRTFGKEALLEGVGVATPSAMAKYFTQDGATVLSF